MRNRETIEREIHRAREDLEASLAELKHVVAEKVDVKARARVALEKGKYMAQDAYERGKVAGRDLAVRGKDNAIDAYYRSREIVSERPLMVAAIVGGVIATGALIYIGRQRHWW